MSRLIDADKLKQHYAWWENGTAEMTLDEAKRNFDAIIGVQPTVDIDAITESHEKIGYDKGFRDGYAQATVDAEPVRHGHWTYLYDGNYKCSECGSWWTCEDTPIESGMLFCPNCGAKMDEVEEDVDIS